MVPDLGACRRKCKDGRNRSRAINSPGDFCTYIFGYTVKLRGRVPNGPAARAS